MNQGILSKDSYVTTSTWTVRSVTKICLETSPSKINVLKKGLKTLKKRVASRKTQLGAFFFDEERVVEVLDNESDYEMGLEKLDTKDGGIVQELISLGGGNKDDAPIEPAPSHHEALQAKITIQKFIETIDDSLCTLESILAE